VTWLAGEAGIDRGAAEQTVAYLGATRATLGVVPTQDTLVLERFFDESGGMQLVLHSPFGSRINKAWGLALRKRFCRQFNFELQAAATEDALLLSLGPQHSFPLADVFRYLHPATVEDVLVQALLDAPMFETRWRWNTTIALAVPRFRGGRKVPPPLQRMLADDLLAAVFPDAAACLENIPGDRQLPDHPLVTQTVRDCLDGAMDVAGLSRILTRIHAGELRLVTRDTPEPSPLSHEILNAKPYAFLDDAPLEERRTQAVHARRASEPASGQDLGALDASAIARVRDEERPDPRDADELHDTLITAGFLSSPEAGALPPDLFAQLSRSRRAALVRLPEGAIWVASDRLPELTAVHPAAAPAATQLSVPASRSARTWTRDTAIVELVRSRLSMVGPTTAACLAASMSIQGADADAALLALESEGVVLRGRFSGADGLEWCDRRLLARIHRYTLNRLRAEIEPIAAADFQRFLFAWHGVSQPHQLAGIDGLRRVLSVLDGVELPASAWERAVLPARLEHYDPAWLDMLCLTGEAAWSRLSAGSGVAGEKPALRVALFPREHGTAWHGRGRTDSGGKQPADSRGAARPGTLVSERAREALSVRGNGRGRSDRRARGRGPGRVGRICRSPRRGSHAAAAAAAPAARGWRGPVVRGPAGGVRRRTRGGDRDPGAGSARPVRSSVQAVARARNARRAVALADGRLSAPRSPRRDPRRTVRQRHVRRTVRAARSRRAIARDTAKRTRRSPDDD
jgi:ATP-dependent Lhr-like helicase